VALSDYDRDLLDRCLDRQAEAWEEFVDRFAGLLIRSVDHAATSRGVRLDASTREDLAGEILVALIRDDFAVLRRFRRRASLATYLTVIARRVAGRSLLSPRFRGPTVSRNLDPIDEKIRARFDDVEQVGRLLGELGDVESRVVQAYYLHGRSYREIARETGLSENSIGPTLARARRKMLAAIEPQTHS